MINNVFTDGYALLIGVGADLPVTVHDASALHALLIDTKRAAYPSEHVEVLTESGASRQSILNAFDRLARRVGNNPNSTVIVYYSGHGGRIEYVDKPSEYFLIPYGYDPSNLSETTITGLEFTHKIEEIGAGKLIVLLDCCHAGGIPALKVPGTTFVKSAMPPTLADILVTGSGRVIIASSRDNEYSYTGRHYSIFTSCLLEALGGQATIDQDGFVRILDVLIYLFRYVPARAPGPQHPLVKKVLDLSDNFAICHLGGADEKSLKQTSVNHPSALLLEMQRHRLKQKYEALTLEWQLISEKVRRMRMALIIETSTASKFQLEQQLLEEEGRIAKLSSEIEEIETSLTDGEKYPK